VHHSAPAEFISKLIIPNSELKIGDQIPGFAKYSTDTFQSPFGDFQVHFYQNPSTGEIYYGMDYKAVFNAAAPRR